MRPRSVIWLCPLRKTGHDTRVIYYYFNFLLLLYFNCILGVLAWIYFYGYCGDVITCDVTSTISSERVNACSANLLLLSIHSKMRRLLQRDVETTWPACGRADVILFPRFAVIWSDCILTIGSKALLATRCRCAAFENCSSGVKIFHVRANAMWISVCDVSK